MYYGDKREAKVMIMEKLIENGWKVYGYKADESDSMVDYYSPASWDGIAEKNGYVLVIDQYNNRQSGYQVKKYNYNNKKYIENKRIAKLTAMMNDSASTENEKASCAVLIEKEKEKAGEGQEYTVIETYPTFQHGNPKACSWHIEKDGQIIAKGKGVFSVNEYNWEDKTKTADEQKAEKLNKFVKKIEKVLTDSDALKSEVVKVEKTVIKPVEKEGKTINIGDILSFSYHGHYWIVNDVYTVGEQIRVTYEILGSEKRGYQRKKNAKRYYQPMNRLEKEMQEGRVKVYTLQEVIEYTEKTVFTKTKRSQKVTNAIQLETQEAYDTQTQDPKENNATDQEQASKRQLWALHCATRLNTTNLVISKQKASDLISKSKAGQNIVEEIEFMMNIDDSNNEAKVSQTTESKKQHDQTNFIEKIDKQIESAQIKLDSLSGNYKTNTWKRQQEEVGREMKRNSLRFDISLLEYLRNKATLNEMTNFEQCLLVGSFRDQIQNYSIQKYEYKYPEIDTRFDLNNWYNAEIPKKQKRLQKAGIYNTHQLIEAVEEYKIIKDKIQRPIDPIKVKIKKLESNVKLVKIYGYFPTPANIVNQMIELADLRDGEIVLEPSAGNGNILDGITVHAQENGLELKLEAIERNHTLSEILKLKNYNVISDDFITYECEIKYDKVIMNPPFEKNQDIEHVLHAYSCLKDGGKLIAIMSPHWTFANDAKSIHFRSWLSDKGYYEKLPDGSFKESGTGVNTILVVIEKIEIEASEAV
ncbi:methyltransferase [Paenibacillus sp. NAIST15-1]|uniref:methyltransferase n=1 Tax=Paenibacillus sp. NAIST15-1 TaxID=1605994 RepID=UPI00086F66BF|nr:methyltransferase [Paenibacillus sp. NAIST15-1]GAV11325.1 DNA-methyltransferase [Paenibacillus sp. NAIST15-1]